MAESASLGSALQINDDTELIEISPEKFKFINPKFEKPPQKLCDYGSDVKLKVGSDVYHTHREVLSDASAYFNAMFSVNMQEKDQKVIELHDISKRGFELLLEYFYHGHVTIGPATIGELVEASRFYQVEWLVNVCIIYMVQYLCFGDYDAALELADLFQLGDISSSALEFIGMRFHQYVDRGDISKLCFEVLLSLLESDVFISVTESELFSYLFENWIKHEKFSELLCSLRFCLLDTECLDIIRKDKLGGDISANKLEQVTKCFMHPFTFDEIPFEETLVRGSEPTLLVFSTTEDITELKCYPFSREATFLHTLKTPLLETYLENSESCCVKNFLILAGGYNHMYTSSSEVVVFDTRDFGFIALPSMLERRVTFGFCANSTHLFAIGGISHSFNDGIDSEEPLKSVECFDLHSNTAWKQLAPLPKAMFDIGVVAHNDIIYVSGGTSNEIDDPIPLLDFWFLSVTADSNGETSTAWTSLPPMKHSRQNHAMFVWKSSIFVFGGVSIDEIDRHNMSNCRHNERFDLEHQVWEDLPLTPVEYGRIYNKCVIMPDDSVYVCSGDEEEKSLRCFDLNNLTWTENFKEVIGDICSHITVLNVALQPL